MYNKTDEFDFNVARYVHADSNVSNSVARNTLNGQIIRFARLTNCYDNFIDRVQELLQQYKIKGFDNHTLKLWIYDIRKNWTPLLAKFNLQDKDDWDLQVGRWLANIN